MPAAFKIKLKYQGASRIEQYTDRDGKVFSESIAGAIEDRIATIAGSKIVEEMEKSRSRTLFLSAVFFQRVVSRTPLDEDYYYTDNKGNLVIHNKDDDVVRDCWVASYNRRKITAKQLRESGITFDRFNDESEIRKIYEIFSKAFIQGKGNRNIKSIRIENTHERFPMLEYGEYLHDGDLKRGELYYHGVEGGYSVQAPHGMLRITEAEFLTMSLNTNSDDLIKNYVRRSQKLRKIPSGSKMNELKRIINKGHVKPDDLDAIERIFQ